jgi:SNF2 family DNA or RNA helicase
LQLKPKFYGKLALDRLANRWVVTETTPNVNLEMKNIFKGISDFETEKFTFDTTLYVSNRLAWFLQMYPMRMSREDEKELKKLCNHFRKRLMDVEGIFVPEFKPPEYVGLKDDCELWDYQCQFVEMFRIVKNMLLGDDYGLGKTNQAIGAMLLPGMLPCAVVVEAHLPDQWKERIEEFSNLRVHIVKTMTAYTLPEADVYIFTYKKLKGFVDIAAKGFFKLVVYDEPQNLRTGDGTDKGDAARKFSNAAEATLGLTATPVMNYGIEMWIVMSYLAPGNLGTRAEFEREWCTHNGKQVRDPDALGAYLRERQVLLRRTEEDIDRAMPPSNVTTQEIPFDESEARKSDELAVQLAIQAMTANDYVERGNAAMQLDTLERLRTGVAKARGVCAYVKILLDSGLPVLLSGWHRDVYEIFLKELAKYNPVMYTGSESKAQKKKSKDAFVAGESNLMIISNRSGAGLDGLQYRCADVVISELDWSPMVLKQLIARLRRYGQESIVNAHYMICNGGADPAMVEVLGVKSSQAHGIMNPYMQPQVVSNDVSRVQRLAISVLERNGVDVASLVKENMAKAA